MTQKALSAEALAETLLHVAAALGHGAADDFRAHIAALEANNAALVKAGREVVSTWTSTKTPVSRADDRRIALVVSRLSSSVEESHPGTALLERHEKALVRARNEGLEKTNVRERNIGLELAHDEVSKAWSRAPTTDEANRLNTLGDKILALREPEQ